MAQTNKRDIEAAAIVNKTARICMVTKRYVWMVIKGDRNNETVLTTYMSLLESNNTTEENLKIERRQCALPDRKKQSKKKAL